MPSHRHRKGGFQFGRTFVIVVAIHGLFGAGLFWLARTESGRQFARVYNIKIFQPEQPPEPEPELQAAPPPPPPPAVEELVKAPEVVAALPVPQAAAPTLGGGGARGGTSWGGGKFVGGFEEGPVGAFHARVTRTFRDAYREPAKQESFGPAVLEVRVAGSGAVTSYRLAQSSGSAVNDRALLDAAERVKAAGVGAPPENEGRVVTVQFVPY